MSSTRTDAQPTSRLLPRWEWLSLATILLLASLLGARAWFAIQAYADYPPDFDEAVHALPALQISRDLRALRLGDLWRHSYTQDEIALYPFLHSWLLAPFFLIAKPDLSVARASGTAFLTASACVMFFLTRGLAARERRPWLAGLFSALLLLTALPLWVYASVILLEAAGLLVTLLWLSAYVRARPDHTGRGWPAAASLAATAALFTKYSFGVFVITAMVGVELLSILAHPRALNLRRLLLLFGPVMILTGAWFLLPGKLDRFLEYSRSQRAQVEFWSAANLLYYPQSLFRFYTAGPLTVALVAAGIGMGVWRWRDHPWRAVVLYLLAGIVLLTRVPQKEIRFFYTVAPLAYPLAGVAFARLINAASEARVTGPARRVTQIGLAGLLALEAGLVARRGSFFGPALETAYLNSPDTRAAYDFVIEHMLAEGARPHLLDTWHLFSNYPLAWEYYVGRDEDPAAYHYQLATADYAPPPTPTNLDRLLERLQTQGTSVLVSIDGSPAGDYTGWQVVEPLITRGRLEMLAASPQYVLFEWSSDYESRVFAGEFATAAELEQARQRGLTLFTIQLHLYRLK